MKDKIVDVVMVLLAILIVTIVPINDIASGRISCRPGRSDWSADYGADSRLAALSAPVTVTAIPKSPALITTGIESRTTARLTDGRVVNTNHVYIFYLAADGKRYVFPDDQTFESWYSDRSEVVTITPEQMASIPIGGNITIRAGTWIVEASVPINPPDRHYWVGQDGVLYPMPLELAMATERGSWPQRVKQVPDVFFVNYTIGRRLSLPRSFPLEGMLFRTRLSGPVYLWDDRMGARLVTAKAMGVNRFQERFVRYRTDILVSRGLLGDTLLGDDSVSVPRGHDLDDDSYWRKHPPPGRQ